jgi:hypothetical protein
MPAVGWGAGRGDRCHRILRHVSLSLIGDYPIGDRQVKNSLRAADPAVFGGPPGEVGSGVVSDPANRTQIQIDVAVLAPAEQGRPRKLLSLGEVKWDRVMDLRHVDRLRRARDLLAVKGFDTRDTVLTCYSGAGFDRDLQAGQRRDIHLVGLDQLYAD